MRGGRWTPLTPPGYGPDLFVDCLQQKVITFFSVPKDLFDDSEMVDRGDI